MVFHDKGFCLLVCVIVLLKLLAFLRSLSTYGLTSNTTKVQARHRNAFHLLFKSVKLSYRKGKKSRTYFTNGCNTNAKDLNFNALKTHLGSCRILFEMFWKSSWDQQTLLHRPPQKRSIDLLLAIQGLVVSGRNV